MLMKLKTPCYAASAVLALCIVHTASAQDRNWTGAGGNDLWSNAGNWTPASVPPPGNPITTFTGNVWLQPVGGVPAVIRIAAGDVESPGVGNSTEVYNTIFGPESGSTLTIEGTLNFDWTIVPWTRDPAPGNRSHINMRGNGIMSTTGASLNLGDGWWETLRAGPYSTVNLYDNSSYNSLGGAGLWLGGHICIYDTASFLVNGYVNMDNLQANNDGTRSIVLGGGTLILPLGTMTGVPAVNSGTVYDWIARGILRAYGKGYDTNDLVIAVLGGTNTFVTPVPLGGALSQVYFQPLIQSTMLQGTFQQATLVGDYPSVTGVLLSSVEPGLDPASFPAPAYSSSNPNVATVNANGMVTAVNPGTTILTASVGVHNSLNSLTVTVAPVLCSTNTLAHRYSFSEASGTTTADLVPGNSPAWDGTLVGGATLGGGQVALDGTTGYVQLPAGLVTNMDEITVEAWASFGATINTWANLFNFGNTDADPLDSTYGAGGDYIGLCPHTGGGTTSMNFAQGLPGYFAERDAVMGSTLDGQANVHIVAVYHPLAGYQALYINGAQVASVSMFNLHIDPVASANPVMNGRSILNYQLGLVGNPFNYIGKSLYNADPTLNATVDEVRIYKGPLTAFQVAADHALGPSQLIGSSTNVTLSASGSGASVVIKWSTTSALVDLMSSPVLGPGAVWTPVNTSGLTVVGGKYVLTVPATGNMFYRLQL
jgi:hypothetical protein